MCSLSSPEMQLFAGGTHTGPRLNDWHSGNLSGTDGMRVCFRTECRGLLLSHLSGRLQECRPRVTRPWNLFTPPKGTMHWNARKDLAAPAETRGNKWDFNLNSDWAALFNSQGAHKFRPNLTQTLQNVNYVFVCCLAAAPPPKISSFCPILWLVLHVWHLIRSISVTSQKSTKIHVPLKKWKKKEEGGEPRGWEENAKGEHPFQWLSAICPQCCMTNMSKRRAQCFVAIAM